VLHKGCIVEKGLYKELIAIEGGVFKELASTVIMEEGGAESCEGSVGEQAGALPLLSKEEECPIDGDGSGVIARKQSTDQQAKNQQLTGIEESTTGVVSRGVWQAYIAAFGGLPTYGFVVLAFSATEWMMAFVDVWIMWWMEEKFGIGNSVYLTAYGCGAVVILIFLVLRSLGYQKIAVRASTRLHHLAMARLIHATMTWFESQVRALTVACACTCLLKLCVCFFSRPFALSYRRPF
jgi:hypothetical protein